MFVPDCGKCKNCKDKKRFGGPGIKKRACCNKEKIKVYNKETKNDYTLYVLSKISSIIIEIDNYEKNINKNIPIDALILLNNIIQFDNEFIITI